MCHMLYTKFIKTEQVFIGYIILIFVLKVLSHDNAAFVGRIAQHVVELKC
jgi:predicted tellurium resistance membrane protein TerC